MIRKFWHSWTLFYPLPFQVEGVLSFPASVPLSICPSARLWTVACPHDNSPESWAGINIFAQNMHLGTLSAVIEDGGHSPWPSMSFWPFWLRILWNSACPCDTSSGIWPRITKFATNMHLGNLLCSTESRGHWPSRSFDHFNSGKGIQRRSCLLI